MKTVSELEYLLTSNEHQAQEWRGNAPVDEWVAVLAELTALKNKTAEQKRPRKQPVTERRKVVEYLASKTCKDGDCNFHLTNE